ncbi:MAG: hypothetical protein A2W22_03265 [Candidatus Levybacteria bacterium RBG_16_35_11]|nr:MAG: hypothetical protein A2W22_03265 [Candidatus Levybacteria bacterium RBG_16_35_11]
MSRNELNLSLPTPEKHAYFPKTEESRVLAEEALRRAGNNLVYAIEYGSHVTGDASPTSRHDMILVVEDTKRFHQRNMQIAASDYGHPHIVALHTHLNSKGFNFYQSLVQVGDQAQRIKYAVISRADFIKGCNGVLREKEKKKAGAFGFYVAGRMQKVALRPLFKGNEKQIAEIETAINTARIDGVWFSLGLLKDEFSFNDLLNIYVSLSYRADIRVEKPNKVQTLIEKSRKDYENMLTPILDSFVSSGLLINTGDGTWKKTQSLSKKETEARLRRLKLKTAWASYIRGFFVFGAGHGIKYALEKIIRAKTE